MGSRIWIFCSSDLLKWNIFIYYTCTPDVHVSVHGAGGSKGGAVVRALASNKFGPGSNPGVKAICGLSLLLVLSLAPRGLSPCTPVFLSPKKWTLPNSNSIWNARRRLNEFVRTPKCLWVNKFQTTIYRVCVQQICFFDWYSKQNLFGWVLN